MPQMSAATTGLLSQDSSLCIGRLDLIDFLGLREIQAEFDFLKVPFSKHRRFLPSEDELGD